MVAKIGWATRKRGITVKAKVILQKSNRILYMRSQVAFNGYTNLKV